MGYERKKFCVQLIEAKEPKRWSVLILKLLFPCRLPFSFASAVHAPLCWQRVPEDARKAGAGGEESIRVNDTTVVAGSSFSLSLMLPESTSLGPSEVTASAGCGSRLRGPALCTPPHRLWVPMNPARLSVPSAEGGWLLPTLTSSTICLVSSPVPG